MYLLGPMAIEDRLLKANEPPVERLRNLEQWLTADLDDPRELSMPEFVCLVRSVRDRVTQIREQLEDVNDG